MPSGLGLTPTAYSSCHCSPVWCDLVWGWGAGRQQPSPVLTCVFRWFFSEGWFLGWCPSHASNPLIAVSPPPGPSVCPACQAQDRWLLPLFCPLLSASPLISAHMPRDLRTGWPPGGAFGPADPASPTGTSAAAAVACACLGQVSKRGCAPAASHSSPEAHLRLGSGPAACGTCLAVSRHVSLSDASSVKLYVVFILQRCFCGM